MGRDSITGLVVLAASLVLLWSTLGLERHPMVPVGPAFYPRIVLGATGALAILLVALDVVAHRRRAIAAAAPAANYALVLATFGVFGVYVLALPYVGFRIGTLVFLVAMQAIMEPPRSLRRGAVMLAVALVATAATYFIFERYLHVLLPRGRWTDF